ncbi:MAG: 3-keto-disaccharide hydrolase [Verrucomicrobiia bacterium]|jgi:hypothetical protein
MKTILVSLALVLWCGCSQAEEPLAFKPLFNGKNLDGWVDVNTSPDTWSVEDGMIVCKGLPIGVMRTDRQYENFILEIEWMHLEAGGNSGVFVWSEGEVTSKNRLPSGMEVQMLELEYPKMHNRVMEYVSGELFGAGTVTAIPDHPRGKRSSSVEYRCKGKGEWNKYTVVCVDGTVKLSINGKFVNGIRGSSVKKGYLCLESEGAQVRFRNIRIMELPGGMATGAEIVPVVD